MATIMICSKDICTGCAACYNICPSRCITMVSDAEGFLHPEIDIENCTDCGACKRVCPIIHALEPNHFATPKVYACWNKDEDIRFQSASGGVFSALAQHVLDEGGIVFGAAFDENMRIKHIAVDRQEDLGKLRSSKYVQSDVGCSYIKVKEFLEQNKKVLFSGTPCQIAALYAVVGQDNRNLITCDILCKGVPSPGLFTRYVKYLETTFQSKLVNINFRHKCKGWELVSTMATFSNGRQSILTNTNNSFMFGFGKGFTIRLSCYHCLYKNIERLGDITLGDFWGIGELVPFNHNTRNGISLILVNSEKGHQFFEETSQRFCFEERTLKEATNRQPVLNYNIPEPKNRKQFFADYQRLEYEELAKKHLVDKGLKRLIKLVIPQTWIFYLRKLIKKLCTII